MGKNAGEVVQKVDLGCCVCFFFSSSKWRKLREKLMNLEFGEDRKMNCYTLQRRVSLGHSGAPRGGPVTPQRRGFARRKENWILFLK